LDDILFRIFSVLSILFLFTALILGWYVFYEWIKEIKGMNRNHFEEGRLARMEAVREELKEDFLVVTKNQAKIINLIHKINEN
jgi:hypothetical protein